MYKNISEQKERLKKLMQAPKRTCVRQEKQCVFCKQILLGTYCLNRHLRNVHKIGDTQNASADNSQNVQNLSPASKWKKVLAQKYQSDL